MIFHLYPIKIGFFRRVGGVRKIILFHENPNILGEIRAHAKFQNCSINPSVRKVCGGERKKKNKLGLSCAKLSSSLANSQANYARLLSSLSSLQANWHYHKLKFTPPLLSPLTALPPPPTPTLNYNQSQAFLSR